MISAPCSVVCPSVNQRLYRKYFRLSVMDVAAAQVEASHVRDEVAERCQKRFHDFLEEWRDEGDHQPKYLDPAKELMKPERNTLQVSMRDIQMFNESLSETITREYYRVYPSLCLALKNFVKDHVDNNLEKDFYLSLTDVDMVHKVRIALICWACISVLR